MSSDSTTLAELSRKLAAFAAERDWDQFHNPKNLAMALAGEAGELIEHFQWLTFEEAANLPPQTREEVALEAADVLLFLLRLCDKLGIDLADSGRAQARDQRARSIPWTSPADARRNTTSSSAPP